MLLTKQFIKLSMERPSLKVRFTPIHGELIRELRHQDYLHQTIDHGNEEYVKRQRGKSIHIKGIEGFWDYLKEYLLKHRGVATYSLICYVKELEFRFNTGDLSTDEMVKKIIKILMNLTLSDD